VVGTILGDSDGADDRRGDLSVDLNHPWVWVAGLAALAVLCIVWAIGADWFRTDAGPMASRKVIGIVSLLALLMLGVIAYVNVRLLHT
jgi:hypothetical protein